VLQHTYVDCAWDKNDYHRTRITQKALTADEIKEQDFKAYLASDDESEDEVPVALQKKTKASEGFEISFDTGIEEPKDKKAKEKKKEEIRNKYQSLLEAVMPRAEEEEGMEITFTPGFLDKAESLVEKKLEEKVNIRRLYWTFYRHLVAA
jgi:hypothetical protein